MISTTLLARRLAPALLGIAAATGLLAAQAARADTFPSRPIRIIVPFSAGGGVDTLARLVGERVGMQIDQPVVVDNRPGASGNIATTMVSQAAPDGYTLLIGANGLAANPTLYPDQPQLDMRKYFTPVAAIGASPLILLSSPAFPAKTLPELISMAKANPGKITYASGGSGTSGHLATELLKSMAGISLTHIPYKGGSQAFVDLTANRVSVMLIDPPLAMPQIKAERLRPIAVGTKERFPLLPDVPTMSESGVPGIEATVWWGFVAPAGTPKPIVDKLNAEINKALADPAVKDKLTEMGVVITAWTPERFGSFLAAETEKWKRVIEQADIRAN